MDVRLPNGAIMRDVPEVATQSEVLRRAVLLGLMTTEDEIAAVRQMPMQGDPSAGGGTLSVGPLDTGIRTPQVVDRALSGAGQALTGLGRGAVQLGQQAISGDVDPALQAEIDASRQLDAPLNATAAGFTGNVAGNIAAGLSLALVPGAGAGASALRGLAAAAGGGAAFGGLQDVASNESRLTNVGVGAAGGTLGYGLGRAASKILSPQLQAGARELIDEGVPVTPGQALGGFAKGVEDRATSLPFVGEGIQSARKRGIEAYNRAALNRVTKTIGKKVKSIGFEGAREAYDLTSEAYGKALKGVAFKEDRVFDRSVGKLLSMAKNMPNESAEQFKRITQTARERFTSGGRMSGETFKSLDSELGDLSRNYRGSSTASERDVGAAVFELQRVFRKLAARQNPSKAKALRNADSAYMKLLRVEDATRRARSNDGVFMPSQLRQATEKFDKSVHKRASAHNKAPLQDLTRSGQSVLPSKYPDSGTAGRLLEAITAGGLSGLAYTNPTAAGLAAAGIGLGSAAYSRPAQWAIRGLLAGRPQWVRSISDALAANPATLGAAGGGLLTGLKN